MDKYFTANSLARIMISKKDDITRQLLSHYGKNFKRANTATIFYIFEFIGENKLEIMTRKLDDPSNAYGSWLLKFAVAMQVLGDEVCEKTDDLYGVITERNVLEPFAYETVERRILELYCKVNNIKTGKVAFKYAREYRKLKHRKSYNQSNKSLEEAQL